MVFLIETKSIWQNHMYIELKLFSFAANQLYKSRVCYSVHGSSQQPQFPGQHRREEGAAITGRRRAAGGPPGLDLFELFEEKTFCLFEKKE